VTALSVTNEIKLFANLCIKQGILSTEDCQRLSHTLKTDSELLDFAQTILEQGREGEFEQIQALLHQAEKMALEGRIPGSNPFKQSESAPADPPANARPKIKLPSKKTDSSQPQPTESTARPSIKAPQPTSPPRDPDLQSQTTEQTLENVIDVDEVYPTWFEPSRLENISDSEAKQALIALLLIAAHEGASDLHICADSRIFVRHNRAIVYKSTGIVSAKVARALNLSILSDEQATGFKDEKDLDFALPFSSGQRFRVNLMQHKEGIAGTYRIVPAKTPSLEELGFPNADRLKELLAFHNGLILVTGPVGSGKTTTLAALIEILNQTREDHIITVEEPIEVIQRSKLCQITQRGVGPHTKTYKRALKGALRQDPDIIVIGEMRDLETIEMAISASETGHLVIATMHTSDASTTLNRLLDVFPPAQQTQIRSMVAESLRGIVCQRLLPNKEGGLTLASELLLQNMAVASLIRDGKIQALGNVMETGRSAGMVQMDYSVLELWKNGIINDDIALANIRNRMLHQQIRDHRATEAASTPANDTEQ
jgi:twitching motility protein PilT